MLNCAIFYECAFPQRGDVPLAFTRHRLVYITASGVVRTVDCCAVSAVYHQHSDMGEHVCVGDVLVSMGSGPEASAADWPLVNNSVPMGLTHYDVVMQTIAAHSSTSFGRTLRFMRPPPGSVDPQAHMTHLRTADLRTATLLFDPSAVAGLIPSPPLRSQAPSDTTASHLLHRPAINAVTVARHALLQQAPPPPPQVAVKALKIRNRGGPFTHPADDASHSDPGTFAYADAIADAFSAAYAAAGTGAGAFGTVSAASTAMEDEVQRRVEAAMESKNREVVSELLRAREEVRCSKHARTLAVRQIIHHPHHPFIAPPPPTHPL